MISSASQEYKNYNSLKASLQQLSRDNSALSRDGDSVRVNQDVAISDQVIIRAGSHFDDDLSTVDSISLSQGNMSKTYQHSGERKWWGLTNQVLEVKAQEGMSFSQATFKDSSLF
jgi:hypothetical protein